MCLFVSEKEKEKLRHKRPEFFQNFPMDQTFLQQVNSDTPLGELLRTLPPTGYVVGIDPAFRNMGWCVLHFDLVATDPDNQPGMYYRRYRACMHREFFMSTSTTSFDGVKRALVLWSQKHYDLLSKAHLVFWEHQFQAKTEKVWRNYAVLMSSWFKDKVNPRTFQSYANQSKRDLGMCCGTHSKNKRMESTVLFQLLGGPLATDMLPLEFCFFQEMIQLKDENGLPRDHYVYNHVTQSNQLRNLGIYKVDDYMSAFLAASWIMAQHYQCQSMAFVYQSIGRIAHAIKLDWKQEAEEKNKRAKAMRAWKMDKMDRIEGPTIPKRNIKKRGGGGSVIIVNSSGEVEEENKRAKKYEMTNADRLLVAELVARWCAQDYYYWEHEMSIMRICRAMPRRLGWTLVDHAWQILRRGVQYKYKRFPGTYIELTWVTRGPEGYIHIRDLEYYRGYIETYCYILVDAVDADSDSEYEEAHTEELSFFVSRPK